MADFSTFEINGAEAFGVKERIFKASPTFLPLIWFATSLAFLGDILMYFATATVSMVYS
jgi:hypothetical protein